MPLTSRYNRNETIPISFTLSEDFDSMPIHENLQIILVESGCVALRINQERCFLQSGALIFRNKNTVIEKLFSHGLVARSISFDPSFINVNLTPEEIHDEVGDIADEYGYPSYHLFYDWSYAYAGVLPLSSLVRPKAYALFSGVISELERQPDNRWSCRARINLLELFRLAEEEYDRFIGDEMPATPLARMVLEYIHANYDQELTVELLCELHHTNHTTLLRDFRALTGTTIGQYILEYRLQLAKEALLFTNLNIEEIAMKFGFRQAAYLSRVFKARNGMSPGQFRSQMNKQRVKEKGD